MIRQLQKQMRPLMVTVEGYKSALGGHGQQIDNTAAGAVWQAAVLQRRGERLRVLEQDLAGNADAITESSTVLNRGWTGRRTFHLTGDARLPHSL